MRESGRRRRFQMRDTMLLSGWLFADLLLALFMIFLAANTAGVKILPTPVAHATPTPTPTFTPTPIPPQRLELTSHHLVLPIDANGLLSDSPSARQSLAQEVRSQSVLQGRTVGLVIAYGNASDASQISTAITISNKVMDVLRTLGQQGFAFTKASYYDPLYCLCNGPNQTEIDLFLFA